MYGIYKTPTLVHVVPLGDVWDHDTSTHLCACNPDVDIERGLVIHDPLDRRNMFEERTLNDGYGHGG